MLKVRSKINNLQRNKVYLKIRNMRPVSRAESKLIDIHERRLLNVSCQRNLDNEFLLLQNITFRGFAHKIWLWIPTTAHVTQN